jgi:hypothetical protein
MAIFRNVMPRKEQRRTERHQVQYLASIDLGDGKPPRTCMISDISEDGARLTVGLQTELPDEFVLLLRRRCRIVRSGQGQVGVQFVKSAQPA